MNGHGQRYIRPELLQQDGTVLWATEEVLQHRSSMTTLAFMPITLQNNILFKIDASDFDATEGACDYALGAVGSVVFTLIT